MEMGVEELVRRLIGCMIQVHKELGAGFLESLYHRALEVELGCQGISFESEKEVSVHYRGRIVGNHRLDLFVANEVVVELKTVEELNANHYAQVRSYLKAVKKRVGLLANFAAHPLDCRRVEIPC